VFGTHPRVVGRRFLRVDDVCLRDTHCLAGSRCDTAVSCPACGRPVAAARPSCLYCGAPLAPTEAGVSAELAGAVTPAPAERTLLVLDLRNVDAALLARALGRAAFEAAQWARRGGYRLHCIAPPDVARLEASRLADAGVRVLSLAETRVRDASKPLVGLGGRWHGDGLDVRTPEGPLRVGSGDVLLIVTGPIVRERQASAAEWRRMRSAAPEAGFRIHVHRCSDVRPVELDPEVFGFGPGTAGSALLQLRAWAHALGRGRPADQAFGQLAPALAPAAGATGSAAAASALAGQTRRPGQEALLLDNVLQFRFYSAWRGTLERKDA